MIQRLRSVFGTNDGIVFTAILIVALAVGRMPEFKGFSVEYPTALYNIFATIVQSLSPILAISLGILIYRREKGREDEGLIKGIVIVAGTFVLALVVMIFAHDLHLISGVGQGVAVGLVLWAVWGVSTVVLEVIRER